MSRTANRQGFTDENRIRLLETDMDDIGTSIDKLRVAVTAEIEGLRKNLETIRNVLIGGLVSFATASVLLGLNLALGN